MRPHVAFVDGSIAPSRGVGGICVVTWRFDERVKKDRIAWVGLDGVLYQDGPDFKVTNNTMELSAIHAACRLLLPITKPGQKVMVWTDSRYAQGCLSGTSHWCPVQNADLIKEYRKTTARPEVEIYWVRGHAGVAWNELANLGAQKVVETKKGFSGGRRAAVSLACAGCIHFACKSTDNQFGFKTSVLRGEYPLPCGRYTRWAPNLLEGAREGVGRTAARALRGRERDEGDEQPGQEAGPRTIEGPPDPEADSDP